MLLTERHQLISSLNPMRRNPCKMPRLSWNLPKALLLHPEVLALDRFLERLMAERGDGVEFLFLFRSAAKGT